MLQPVVRRSWAPRGQTPIHYSWDRHDRLSALSAITLAPQRKRVSLYFELYEQNIHTEQLCAFLRRLHQRLRRGIILVLDRWSVHRAAVKQLLAWYPQSLEVEWLPAYAPDLNPTEQVWNHTKYTDLANYLPQDLDDLRAQVARSIEQSGQLPSLLRSFFQTAQLDL